MQRFVVSLTTLALSVLCGAASTQGESPEKGRREQEQKFIAVLQGEAPLFEKARACQQLAVVGSKRTVPMLAGLLGDKSLSHYARFALEPIDDPSVDDALRGAMGKLKGRLLAGVVTSIGVRRDAKAVGQLRKLLTQDDNTVAAAALAALGRIATDQATQAIRQTLTKGPEALRAAAADACLSAAEYLLASRQGDRAIALCDAVRNAKVPDHVRTAATYRAILSRGVAGLPLLMEQLKSKDPARIGIGLRAARKLRGKGVPQRLAAALGETPPGLQAQLIKVLVDRGDPGARAAVASLTDSKTAAVRLESVKALGRIGDAACVPALLKAAGGSGGEATAARASLRSLDGDGVDAAILKGMKGAKGDLRVELIGVLTDRHYAPAGKAMVAEAASSDQNAARAAFKALGVLAGAEELPAMVKLLSSVAAGANASQAETAIVAVAARVPEASKRADAVLAALASAKQPATRTSLVRILGRVGGNKALAAVTEAAGSSNDKVKDAAVRALAGWPDAKAAPTLLGMVKNTKNKTRRILALRGYIRLLALEADRDPQAAIRQYREAMDLGKGSDAADTRKLVLSGLAGVAHADAMKVVLTCLDDASIRAEAAVAAVSIARRIMGAHRKRTRAAMEKVITTAKGTPPAVDAQRIIRKINAFGDCITAWRLAGPYTREGLKYNQLFDVAFAPETAGAKGVVWRLLAAGTDPKRASIMDLLKAIGGGEQRVAYALTWVHSDKPRPARLAMGSDDGVKAWLNGKLVHANNVARAAIPYTDKADITLSAGWNRLMLKITQNQGPWAFCARICSRKDESLEGIRIDCTHKGN